MKLSNIGLGLSKIAGKTGLRLQKHSPEILLVVGVGGVVASTVLACRATLKVDAVLASHRENIEKFKECRELVAAGQIPSDEYTDEEYKKDLAISYTQTGMAFVKLYWPCVTLMVAGIACIVGSHGVMKKRNLGLIAAYKAVEEGFAQYRKRVVDEYGEEKDYMLKHGLRQEVVELECDDDGKPKKVKKKKLTNGDTNGLSVYAKYFDDSNSNWSPNADYNLMFLKLQQNYMNDMLKARGHVFLNEVYKQLGIPHTQAGAVCGWVLGDDGGGDNFIDFGIFDGDKPMSRDFVNGYKDSILLDFNVDGVIYDLLK